MKRKRLITSAVAFLFLVCLFCEVLFSENYLNISSMNIKTDKTTASFRAVVISDLHNREYGKNNKKLLRMIYEQEPDVIFVLGDMLNKDEKDRSVAVDFYNELVKITNVYACLGNHERDYYDLAGLKRDIKKAGVRLLEDEMEQVDFTSGSITVGALAYFPYYEWDAPDYNSPSRRFLDSYIEQQKDNFSFLLIHEPEMFTWGLENKDIELALCAHTHGGIIRLPFIGGLIAPNQGLMAGHGELLPKYTKGYYDTGKANIYITGGLGGNTLFKRFYNPVEISVINVN